jgi:hypothetical protein
MRLSRISIGKNNLLINQFLWDIPPIKSPMRVKTLVSDQEKSLDKSEGLG